MTTMIFYEKPVALNRERHRRLKLDRRDGQFGFARSTNSVLLAATEIGDAAKDYPVVFVAGPGGQYVLAALLGLRERENLFVGADGHWRAGAYLPAFVRRYPFVLAEGGDGPLTVCVDESFPGLGDTEGQALFDEDGQDSALLTDATDFLKRFHAEMQRSRAFTARLAALGLLAPKTIRASRDGQQEILDGFHVVDEQKLRALDDAQALELFRCGDLFLIHAHLCSLGNVERLGQMAPAAAPAKPGRAAGRKTPAKPRPPRKRG
jgi:hypothetical protein